MHYSLAKKCPQLNAGTIFYEEIPPQFNPLFFTHTLLSQSMYEKEPRKVSVGANSYQYTTRIRKNGKKKMETIGPCIHWLADIFHHSFGSVVISLSLTH